MISRRQLIGRGMALSALGLGSRAASALEPLTSRASRVTHLIIDTRFDEALEIARQAVPPGVTLIALPRDVLGLWHDRLLPVLHSSSQAIAGVTTEYGYFALRILATDQRLPAQLTARHAVARSVRHDETLVSWVIGPAA